MSIEHILSIQAPELALFSQLTEAQLRKGENGGLFIAESPLVIDRAIDAGYTPVALLCEERLLGEKIQKLQSLFPRLAIYAGVREQLCQLTGFELTRGMLCAFRRKPLKEWKEICRGARRVLVLDHVVDATNIGLMFRTAAAIGFDAVLLTGQCCDPLTRRSVRTSMGTVFMVPWAWIDTSVSELKTEGFLTVAMALKNNSLSVEDPLLGTQPRLALIMGNEGDGLSDKTIEEADYTVMIPMAHGVDSLNVGAAAAIAMWETRIRDRVC